MIKRICKICNKTFFVHPSALKVGGIYCSKKCLYKSRTTRIERICPICGKTFYVHQGRKDIRKTCSYKCSGKIRTGVKKPYMSTRKMEDTPHWKGGTIFHDGYKKIIVPKRGYIKNSRLIAEKHIDRLLEPTEIVHHIDGDKSNDNPSNLFVFENRAEHMRFHKNLQYGNSFLKWWLKSNLI